MIGEVVAGRYHLEAQLGEGGMGAVWWAKDRSTGEDVALKRITLGRTSAHRRAELRFQREFHTLASLRHPRILRAFDYGVDERGPYYTMELLGGTDLGDLLRDRAPLPPEEACRYLRDIASGLAALHARGLVHRDLSPRNVRIVDGRAILFDFGVLMPAGIATDVAGTPSYLAPELLEGVPVDGRADLYALGVLAYGMVTGTKPYDARSLAELPEALAQPLVPPSAHAEVPEGLEDLILDLLSQEPLARPPSAAVLIDRFTALGELAPDPEIVVAPGFVTSAALVGRDEPLEVLDELVGRIVDPREGAGRSSFLLEGESGAGKSRLLTEMAMRAKLAGATPLVVGAEEAEGRPYGTLAALVDEAFAVMPDEAALASRADARWLGRLFPPVRRAHPMRDRDDGAEPAEDRLRAQLAARTFIRRLAERRPLVVLIDDAQRMDEASGAALLAMAAEAPPGLVLGFTRRTGESLRAPELDGALRRIEPRLQLGGLEAEGVGELARSLLGDVPHLSRLAKAVHEATGGNPLFCTEAIRRLIDRGELRYAAGSWIVPAEIRTADIPAGLGDALHGRLQGLGALATQLAELLAVHGGQVQLDRIVALAEGRLLEPGDPAPLFGALSELALQGIVTERGVGLGLRSEAFRQAVLARLDEATRRSLHAHVGTVLAADPSVPAERTGWHLVRGGDIARGAPMLERAGRALYEAQALADCIEPLEMALEAREAAGAPAAVIAELKYMLVNAGWVSDRQVAARHGEDAAVLLGDLAGVETMRRWQRFVGWRLAFVVAITWAGLRWLGRFGEARGPTPIRALTHFAIGLTYATAVAYAANQKSEVRRLAERMQPFRAFRGHPPYAAYQMIQAMLDVLEGRLVSATEQLGEISRMVTRPWLNPLRPMERRVADAGARSVRITVDVNQFDPRLHVDLAAIQAIGLVYYAHCARSIEAVHRRYRGEEADARRLEAELEAEELQLGSWSTELQRLLFAHPAYALTHDVEGLKRCLDGLERRAADGMNVSERITITRAELLRERGRPEEALATLGALFDALDPEDHLYRQWGHSAAAQAALESYQWEQAAEHARRVLEDAADPAVRVMLPWLRAQRVLGLAEDALGQSGEGARIIQEALVVAEAIDCPVLAGELHEARARIAFAIADRPAFLHHRLRCEQWLRPTGNPGLVSVVERLFELDRESEIGPVDARRRRPGASSDATSGTRSSRSDLGADAATVADVPSSIVGQREGSHSGAFTKSDPTEEATVVSRPAGKSEG